MKLVSCVAVYVIQYACLPTRLPACLPACLPARLPACLSAISRSKWIY